MFLFNGFMDESVRKGVETAASICASMYTELKPCANEKSQWRVASADFSPIARFRSE
jgi:hypothetical protein